MDKRLVQLVISLGGVLLVFFLVSLLLFIFLNGKTTERVLFFPHDITGELHGERRTLPKQETAEEDVALYLRELLLGPSAFVHRNLLPENTDLHSIMLRDKTLFIDFGDKIIFAQEYIDKNFEWVTDAVKKAVRFNFPSIDTIIITINGQQPLSEEKTLSEEV
jgi:spore germination protein GerM